jgi:hypothetical protein
MLPARSGRVTPNRHAGTGHDRRHSETAPINGAIQINIAKSDTMLDPSRYNDALQVVSGAQKDVFWTGQIVVCANPFAV